MPTLKRLHSVVGIGAFHQLNANDQLTNRELCAARSASWFLFLWLARGERKKEEEEKELKGDRREGDKGTGASRSLSVDRWIDESVDRRIGGFVTLSIFNRASGWHVCLPTRYVAKT